MINLNIEFDRKKFGDLLSRVSKLTTESEIDKAINRAAKRAAITARAVTVKTLASEYTLPAEKIRDTITAKNLGQGRVGAVMQMISSPIAATKFRGTLPKETMPPEKGPARTRYKKKSKSKRHPHAFVARTKSGHLGVFERIKPKEVTASGKWRLKQYFGPSTVGMFKANPIVHEAALKAAGETFSKRVAHELGRLADGI